MPAARDAPPARDASRPHATDAARTRPMLAARDVSQTQGA